MARCQRSQWDGMQCHEAAEWRWLSIPNQAPVGLSQTEVINQRVLLWLCTPCRDEVAAQIFPTNQRIFS